jgi:[acyl-carrier-protein] S-malonyltransferase
MTKSKTKKGDFSNLAFIFPGQGAQAVGMGRDLYDNSPAARALFEEVDGALGRKLTTLMFEGPEEELRQTANAQPAIMAVSLATVRAIEEQAGFGGLPAPAMMAGHSLGEYTALAVSGVLGVADTARLVEERGRLMQRACEMSPGNMAAIIGLDQMTVEEISRQTGTYVSNVNTGEQVVISGEVLAVARALDMASARGAKKAIPLRVGGAFHSALMKPARDGLAKAVGDLDLRNPSVPIVANMTGEPVYTASELRQELVSQVCECVQWKRSVEYMIGSGVTNFVEIGPGRALTGMIKRIDRSVATNAVGDQASVSSFSLN